MGKQPLTTVSSRQVYENPWIRVYEDVIKRPFGKKGIYGYVRQRRTVGIFPTDQSGTIYLCKQYRYIFKDYSWEIPRGFIDDGETKRDAAKRELNEEAGLTAKNYKHIGSLRLAIGILDEECHVYLATGCTEIREYEAEAGEIQEIRPFTLVSLEKMIEKGEIKDGLTIGAFTLARSNLQRYL